MYIGFCGMSKLDEMTAFNCPHFSIIDAYYGCKLVYLHFNDD